MDREFHQLFLGSRRGNPRHGTDLGVGEIAILKSIGRQRQIKECLGHTEFLPSGTESHPAFEVHPQQRLPFEQ